MNRGCSKLAASNEHLACCSNLKEKIKLCDMGKEVGSLFNIKAIKKIISTF